MYALQAQEPASYTYIEQEVWAILYNRQLRAIQKYAYARFAMGLLQLGLTAERMPIFRELNEPLGELTGWEVYAVPGLIPNRDFFTFMASKRFGATTWIRNREQLDYLEEPDLFHDIFGHAPLLADPVIADFLYGLALMAARYINNEDVIEALARLYWYTIEFGLVREGGEIRIYGAGILSSIGETRFVLSEAANRVPFDLGQVLATPYIKDKFQEQYFVLGSMNQLREALDCLDTFW